MASCKTNQQCGYGSYCMYDPTANQNYCKCTDDRYWNTSSTYCGNYIAMLKLLISMEIYYFNSWKFFI